MCFLSRLMRISLARIETRRDGSWLEYYGVMLDPIFVLFYREPVM